MNESRKQIAKSLALLLLGLSLLAAAYANALAVPFVWDDHGLIEENPVVLQTEAWKQVFHASFWALPHRSAANSYYRPLTIASFVSDAKLFGVTPKGFHITNLFLHFVNCILLFALVRRTGAPAYSACLALLLFGAMPRLTESVTWISGRTDLLATMGAAFAILLYRPQASAGKWRMAAAIALFLGLLGKEVALASLIAVSAYEWSLASFAQTTQKKVILQIKEIALNLFPLLFAVALYLNLRGQAGVRQHPTFSLDFMQQIACALQALGLYCWMLLTPFHPNLYVGTLGIFVAWQIVLGILVAAAICIAVTSIVRRKLQPASATFLALCIAAILPVIHLIRLPLRPLAADRFLYLPCFALCALLFANWTRIPARAKRPAGAILAILALSFLWATHQRNSEWSDEVRIWKTTVDKMESVSPKNGLAHSALAGTLSKRGKFEEALPYFERAYALEKQFQTLYPDYQIERSLQAGWAITLSAVGRIVPAAEMLRDLVAALPNEAEFRYLYANVLARQFNFEAADQQFSAALRLYPQYSQAHKMREQMRQAALLWQSLPPERENETTPLRAQRGFVYFLVGRLPEANQIWIAAVRAADSDRELLEQAELVLEGERHLFGESRETQALAEAIAMRKRALTEPALEKP